MRDKKVIPDEIVELGEKLEALYELRDKYATLPFGFKRARKCAIEALKYKGIFLRKVAEIYPELINVKVTYNLIEKTVWKATTEDYNEFGSH